MVNSATPSTARRSLVITSLLHFRKKSMFVVLPKKGQFDMGWDKYREQTLERTVRETTEKKATLEASVAQLEMENRWLKNLLTEKHESTSSRMPPPPEDSTALNQKGNGGGNGQKHIQPKKKGVGTDN